MKNLIKIECDVFGIVKRLKRIDESYCVFYNTSSKRYEVHSMQQERNSFCFSLPYESLDERAIGHAFKTRTTNMDLLLKEIERDNLLLYEKKMKENVEILKELL